MPWQSSSPTVPRAALQDEDMGPFDILVTSILLALATVFLLLRVAARRMNKVWGPEDWFCIGALASLLLSGALNYVQVANGLGHHSVFVPLEQQAINVKCLLALECLYNLTMMLVKFSYCYMYRRLFPNLKLVIYTVGAFVMGWGVSFIFVCLFQCKPMTRLWDPTEPGTCLDPRPLFVSNAALNFVSDMALLCIPITQVIKLQMKTAVKVSVCSIFILGGFTSFSGVYRIKPLLEVDPTDVTWTFVNSNIWTIGEMCCTIIGACLPTLRPLLSKISDSFRSYASRGRDTEVSRIRQTRTQTTLRERPDSDSTIYLPIYRPPSRALGPMDSPIKDNGSEPHSDDFAY